MLTGQSILCFAPDPWDDLWRNRHQIMSILARQNRVLYVEPRPYLRDVLGQARRHELRSTELFGPRVHRISDGLSIYRPPLYAPLSGRAPLSQLTDAVRRAQLAATLRRLGMTAPILWLFRPDQADVPGRYGERMLVYHIVDEYTGYADVATGRREAIRLREQMLIERADLVLVTSEALLEAKSGINPNTHWVPNAVDYPRFRRAAEDAHEPDEIAATSRPRIGYVGAINDKIDLGLLEQVADAYPAAALILVGPVRIAEAARVAWSRLIGRANVHHVDRVPVERVPDFVQSLDAGLLPYRLNQWTRHIHPLKLYEYLACGLPVVATDLPSLRAESDVVRIAGTPEQFVSAIRGELQGNDDARRQIRRLRASQNTWSNRVERISELIEETLSLNGKR